MAIGRPKGASSKVNRLVRTKAAKSGIMPLDVLLHHMREMHWEAVRLAELAGDTDEYTARIITCRNAATQMAKDAAPYVHAKLISSEVSGKDGGAIQIAADMSDQELARRVAIMLAPKPLLLTSTPVMHPSPVQPLDIIDVAGSSDTMRQPIDGAATGDREAPPVDREAVPPPVGGEPCSSAP